MKKFFSLIGSLLLVVAAANAQTWNGNSSNVWGTGANWSGGAAPTANTDAIIPSGRPNYPTVVSNGTCRTLTINSGATLTVPTSKTLTINYSTASATTLSNSGTLNINGRVIVKNNVVNNGSIVSGPGNTSVSLPNGMLQFDNTVAATVSGTGTTQLTDVIFSNNATVTFSSTLTNQVKIGRVAKLRLYNVVANGKVRLTSNSSTTTGLIDDSSTGRITGDITVERDIYTAINDSVGYRHYSTPVASPAFSTLATTGFTPIIESTYTYPGTVSFPTFPNVFYYDESLVPTTVPTRVCNPKPGCTYNAQNPCVYHAFEYGWKCPTSSSATMITTKGYTVRIDAASPPVALSGVANTGTYTTGILGRGGNAESGWHFLGNPYPSPISINRTISDNIYDAGTGSGVDATVWFFRSLSDTADYCNPIIIRGEYQWINTVTGATSDSATQTEFFPVMQGFFVRKPSGSTPSVFTFTNMQRETTYPTSPALTPFYRQAASTGPARPIAVAFSLTDVATKRQEQAFVGFRPDATAGHDARFDAVRPADNDQAPTLYTLNTASEPCAYNMLPTLAGTVTLPLVMHSLVPGRNYALRLRNNTLAPGTRVFLDDRQKGVSRELTHQPGYDFTAGDNAYDNRFVLRFEAPATATIAQTEVTTYPNPGEVGTPLEFESKAVKGHTATATLLDTFGRTVASLEVPVRDGQLAGNLTTKGLAPGIYILRLNAADKVNTQRIQIR